MSKVGEVLAKLDGKTIESCPSIDHKARNLKGSGVIIMRVSKEGSASSWHGSLFEPCPEHVSLEYWNKDLPKNSELSYVLYEYTL